MNFRRIITAGAITGMMVVTGCASNVPSNNDGNRNGERLTQAVNRDDNDVRRTDMTRNIGRDRRDNGVRRSNVIDRDTNVRRDAIGTGSVTRGTGIERSVGTPGAVTAASPAPRSADKAIYVEPNGRRVVEPARAVADTRWPAPRSGNSVDLRRDSLSEESDSRSEETVPASFSSVRPVTRSVPARQPAGRVQRVYSPRGVVVHAQHQINAQIQAHIDAINSNIRQQNLDRQQTAIRNRQAVAALNDENRTTSNRADIRSRRDAITNGPNFESMRNSARRMGSPRRAGRGTRSEAHRNGYYRDGERRTDSKRDGYYRDGERRYDSYRDGGNSERRYDSYRDGYYKSQDFRGAGYRNNSDRNNGTNGINATNGTTGINATNGNTAVGTQMK